MNLNDIHRGVHTAKPRKRLGRGIGSGQGKTAGRGHKGQWSHNGVSFSPIFQGGASPLVRRIPKRGFNNQWARIVVSVNLGELDELFAAGEEVTPETLKAKGRLKVRYELLKILGNGQLTKKLKISAHRFSEAAAEKIKHAGGEVVILAGPAPVKRPEKSKGKAKRAAASK